ncbi:MAG: FkbM family methyltransferase [Gemmatimonadales bacterium]
MAPRSRRPFGELVSTLGILPATRYWIQWKLNRFGVHRTPYRLTSRAAAHPLWCRPSSSDRDVFNQVFIAGEYGCLDEVAAPALIIDCGANVGYTAAYLLTRFPTATVVAVEPDAENVTMLRRNLAPYGTRARITARAVWSHRTGLVPNEVPWGDGRAWARRVREARPGEVPAMMGIDVGSLAAEAGFARISILKVDIEGAESVVFGPSSAAWLGRVDHIAIELHGDECAAIFHAAIANHPFDLARSGELVVGHRRPTDGGSDAPVRPR